MKRLKISLILGVLFASSCLSPCYAGMAYGIPQTIITINENGEICWQEEGREYQYLYVKFQYIPMLEDPMCPVDTNGDPLPCPDTGYNPDEPWSCSEGVSENRACDNEGNCCFPFYIEPSTELLFFDLVGRDETFDGQNWVCIDDAEEHGARVPCTCRS